MASSVKEWESFSPLINYEPFTLGINTFSSSTLHLCSFMLMGPLASWSDELLTWAQSSKTLSSRAQRSKRTYRVKLVDLSGPVDQMGGPRWLIGWLATLVGRVDRVVQSKQSSLSG